MPDLQKRTLNVEVI